MKIGKTKRQRQSVIPEFSFVMTKRKSQGDSNNTESVEESGKQNVCITINKKTDCVGVLNSVKGKYRRYGASVIGGQTHLPSFL